MAVIGTGFDKTPSKQLFKPKGKKLMPRKKKAKPRKRSPIKPKKRGYGY